MIDKQLKLHQSIDIKSVTLSNDSSVAIIEGYASVYRTADGSLQVDRDYEVVNTDNIDISDYLLNPVLVFNHKWDVVIGKTLTLTKDYTGLKITAEVHKLTGLEHIFEGVVKGLIKSFSVGFIPQDYKYHTDDLLEITRASLIEISLAPVQSNPAAIFDVIGTKSLGVSAKQLKEQNNLTCTDMQCMLKKLKGDDKMSEKVISKEAEASNEVTKTEPKQEAGQTAPVTPVESKQEVKPEPTTEVKTEPKQEAGQTAPVTPNVDLATLVNGMVEAQLKIDEIKKQQAEELEKKKQEEEQAKAQQEQDKVKTVLEYLQTQAKLIKDTPVSELDVDSYESLYTAVVEVQETLESKVLEAIEASKGQVA